MAEMPKAADLFGDTSPKAAASSMEAYLGELNKSLGNPSTVPGQAPAADPIATI